MSEGPKRKPPSLTETIKNETTDRTNSLYQLQVLTEFMAREFLGLSKEKISELIEQYDVENHPEAIREFYDNVIDSINVTPNKKRARLHLGKMTNIFNDYSSITPESRAFETPNGIKVHETIGEYTDGRCKVFAKLKPWEPAPPSPMSPILEREFPPSGNLVNAEGFVSPTSPPQYAEEPRWPRRVADASVIPPRQRNTPASGSGIDEVQRRWGGGDPTYRDVIEKGKGKGKAPYAEDNTPLVPIIRHDAPIIQLDIKPKQDKRAHDGTSYVGATPSEIWSTRELYAASHKLTIYLRHGDRQHVYHNDDGYVDVNIIVQLPLFKFNKPIPINQKCIELILMLYDSRIESDPHSLTPNTRIRAIQGHTLKDLKIECLYY